MGSIDYVELKKALVRRMEHYDKALEDLLKREDVKISCKRGCDHCCYLLTTIHPLEGLLLAEEVLSRPHWRRKAQELGENAHKCHAAGYTRANYFEAQVPCPFLDLETRDCEVYRVRPSPCRYHVVTTPVEKCFSTYRGDDIAMPDNTVPLADILKFCMETTKIAASAPPALMVLWCMEQLLGGKENRRFVKRLREGLPHPLEWMKDAVKAWDNDGESDEYKEIRRIGASKVFGEKFLRPYDRAMAILEKADV